MVSPKLAIPTLTQAYGLEFSPDGTKLYSVRHDSAGINSTFAHLYQYDLSAGSATAIGSSETHIYSYGHNYHLNDMQVGPDGKIYEIASSTRRYLNVINRPNLKGKACRFVPNAIDLDPGTGRTRFSERFLPSFVQSYFYRPKIDLQQTCFGDTARFQLSNNAYVDSVRWNFGDPASGALNKSTAFNPKHFYATPGPKQVQAIVHFNFTSDTLNQTIYIPVSITKPNLGPDRSICPGDTLLLRAFQPGATYEWQDSINTDSIYVVTKPGTYWVQVSNGCGVRTDSVTITFDQPLSLSLGADTLLCPGQQLQLQVNASGASVLWSDSTTGNSITVTQPGTYWAQLSNSCGSWRDSINVSYRPAPVAQWLPNDLTLCKQTQYTINGTHPDALSYKWQDGSTSSTFTATVSGTYWLEVTTACTTVRDSIHITLIPTPPINLGPDTLLCPSERLQLQVSTRGGNIRWQDGSTDTTFTVTKAGIYWAQISNSCGSWRDSVRVSYRSPSITNWLPKDTTLCLQNRFVINGQHPDAISYKWQDGSSNVVFEAKTSGIYWVDVTTACTTLRDSVQITLLPLPARLLPTDTLLCSGESIHLKAPPGKSYKWSNGQTSQSITVSQPGAYKVEVGMGENCFYSGAVNVKEERCYRTAFIPNLITPNNDNTNDRFDPKGLEAGPWQLEIYNRWGSRIYQNSNYTNQWPEQDIPAATYYYLLRNKESGKTYKGWIEVVK
ncbi:T9SS type B sorting domain-containing protein [Adhaeribacter soli]|nr:gliding motility-associated C-terminal domain-containing protein [Adhaeribacter soli]